MRKRRRSGEEDDINMTPMLDIVFIMLIFFIVTASFVREVGLDIKRPPPAKDNQETDPKKKSIFIAVSETGQIWVNNQLVDVRLVTAKVQQIMAERQSTTLPIIIQSDESAKNGVIIQIIDAAKMAGASNISITAKTS